MEVTHLYRNVMKHLPDSKPAIEDNSLESKSLTLKSPSSLLVNINGLMLDFLGIQVLS
jgi:hypothetical protein